MWHSITMQLLSDVSGQRTGLIFIGRNVQKLMYSLDTSTLEYQTTTFSRNCGNQLPSDTASCPITVHKYCYPKCVPDFRTRYTNHFVCKMLHHHISDCQLLRPWESYEQASPLREFWLPPRSGKNPRSSGILLHRRFGTTWWSPVVPKRPHRTTTQGCVISQISADLKRDPYSHHDKHDSVILPFHRPTFSTSICK
jgi:hypothetical protein